MRKDNIITVWGHRSYKCPPYNEKTFFVYAKTLLRSVNQLVHLTNVVSGMCILFVLRLVMY